jgi:hypothetical protein
MIDDVTKRSILNHIIQSQEFVNSQSYQKLLSYLVENSINNKTPKEYSIATEIFNKDADFDPTQDTLVRVHIYKLRKKLENYYNKEGKNDKIRIEIPRGHYNVNFITNSKETSWKKRYRLYVAVLFIFIILSHIFYLLKIYNIKKTIHYPDSLKQDAVWKDYFQNEHSKMVVLGDHFFYVKDHTNTLKRTIMRRDDINSMEEYQEYLQKIPDSHNYRVLTYQLFPKNSIWPFSDLHPVLSCLSEKYILKASSQVIASDIVENNIIFLGSFHTLSIFKDTFRNSNFDYHVYPNSITLKDSINGPVQMYPDDTYPKLYHTDYGLFRKIPGPSKNVIYIFTSFHETGIIGIIQYFIQAETLKEIENMCRDKFGYLPSYFEILFKSSGYNRTVYTTEVEQIYEINPNKVIW